MKPFSRADRSLLARWWGSIDFGLAGLILALAVIGLIATLAASPAVALRRGGSELALFRHQIVFILMALGLGTAVSTFSARDIRRLSLALLVAGIGCLIAVLSTGHDTNGARRWLSLGGVSFQPSEIVKPVFIVVEGFLIAESTRRPDMPAWPLALGALLLVVPLIALEPDVGQTTLVVIGFVAMLLVASRSVLVPALTAGLGGLGLIAAYYRLDYVRLRVDRYLSGSIDTSSQVGRALKAFSEGGLFGVGPGEGHVKLELPDAHTDFILAVLAEEFGAITCLLLVAIYGLIAVKGMAAALRARDEATRLAIVGLVAIFSAQAAINMGVNLGLLPAKGMTLPFVSAGGSSALGIGLELGLLLGLARRARGARVREQGALEGPGVPLAPLRGGSTG